MTIREIILNKSPLSAGTIREHFAAMEDCEGGGGGGTIVHRVYGNYNVKYIPEEQGRISYIKDKEVELSYQKDEINAIEYIEEKKIKITYIPNKVIKTKIKC